MTIDPLFQVRWDEWTGSFWMQRVTDPMSMNKAAERYREIGARGHVRNIALCHDMPSA